MATSREEWLAEMVDALGLDPEEVIEVAAMFFEAIEDRLARIEDAYTTGDMHNLNRLAHGLKGDAANMGFSESSVIAREIEVQSRRGEVANFDSKLAELRDSVKRSFNLVFEGAT